jgi:ParB/RepB/Spo0J family partition protein
VEEKKTTPGAEGEARTPEAAAPDVPAPDIPAPPESGDVVISADQIDELMAERRAAARDAVEKEEPPAQDADAPEKKPRRGRPPKVDKPGPEEPALTVEEAAILEHEGQAALFEMGEAVPDPGGMDVPPPPEAEAPDAGKVVDFAAAHGKREKDKAPDKTAEGKETAAPRRGRPPKADKAAPGKGQQSRPRDKVSRSKKDAPAKDKPPVKAPEQAPSGSGIGSGPATPAEPAPPPRPVEEGKLIYLKLSEVHPFHTFRPHPFQVRDDAKMQETVASIKANGVMVPGLARPEKDGNGYEIVAGHRRCRGSELAGLEEMPFIVRDMTDHEAVQAMKDSNKQRDQMLPSELAALLDLEVEDIKHQGGRLKNVAEGDIGKRSVEIVGEAHGMNYKKVMRYLRLNSLVPELLNMADEKKLGFMPAVELSYIKPKNQRLVAVSIDGEQSSPSVAQAKKMRELDQEGKLTGDVIDGILSEKKKEDRGVIISTAELEKYFGKEVTPAKMKEQIMTLLDDWKQKQPPELAKAPKKMEKDK